MGWGNRKLRPDKETSSVAVVEEWASDDPELISELAERITNPHEEDPDLPF
jgi:hypothetical protein